MTNVSTGMLNGEIPYLAKPWSWSQRPTSSVHTAANCSKSWRG